MVKRNFRNVIYLSTTDFNNRTGASYARMIEFARGLTKYGINVYFASIFEEYETRKVSPFEAIKGVYTLGKGANNYEHFLARKFKINDRRKVFLSILNYVKTLPGRSVFYVYPPIWSSIEEYVYLRYLKKHGYKVFSERNENYLGKALNMTVPKRIDRRLIFFCIYPFIVLDGLLQDMLVRFYDGNVVVSRTFEKWIKKRNNNYIKIPVLVNPAIVKSNEEDVNLTYIPDNIFNIGYTGSFNFKKDSLDILLKVVYILVHLKKKHVKLNVYGFGNRSERQILCKLIKKLSIVDYVVIRDGIRQHEIPEILKKQDLLILIRRQNRQTKFGFSTKFAEYMGSGTTVLTSIVSDNLLFLKDSINGFVTFSMKSEIIANKIIEISNLNAGFLQEITVQAKKTAFQYFNINSYSQDLVTFLGT